MVKKRTAAKAADRNGAMTHEAAIWEMDPFFQPQLRGD